MEPIRGLLAEAATAPTDGMFKPQPLAMSERGREVAAPAAGRCGTRSAVRSERINACGEESAQRRQIGRRCDTVADGPVVDPSMGRGLAATTNVLAAAEQLSMDKDCEFGHDTHTRGLRVCLFMTRCASSDGLGHGPECGVLHQRRAIQPEWRISLATATPGTVSFVISEVTG